MVSTRDGVRGLEVLGDVHAAIASRPEFVWAVNALLAEPVRCKALAQRGLALARSKYTWEAIAKGFRQDISYRAA